MGGVQPGGALPTGFFIQFLFSLTDCHTKVKFARLLTHTWKEISCIHIFPKVTLCEMQTALSRSGHCVHLLWRKPDSNNQANLNQPLKRNFIIFFFFIEIHIDSVEKELF